MERCFLKVQILFLGLILLFGQIAFANDQENETSEFMLEEIVVSALKRETNVQDTAVSTTAISGEILEEEGKYQLMEIMENIPGVSIRGDTHGAKFFIRGVVENFAWAADPVTATYSDGVYVANPGEARAGFYDMQRVEVLRGPQGTLYGMNAMGGSVNLISNDPVLDSFKAKSSLEVGNYSLVHFEGVLNAPVSDTMALRTAVAVENRDGYLSNGQSDSKMGSGRIKLLYRPNDEFRAVFSSDYSKTGGQGGGSAGPWDMDEGLVEDLSDPWYSGVSSDNENEQESVRVYANFAYDLGFASVTYQPTYSSFETDMDHIFWGNRIIDQRDTSMTTHELRFNSPEDSEITWVTGLNYLWKDTPVTFIMPFGGAKALEDSTESKGIFGQLTYPIFKNISMTGGLRYTMDSKTTANQDIDGGPITRASTDFGSTTWKIGFEGEVNEDSMLYLTVSTGYRAGGHQASNNSGDLQPYKKQELLAYQFGSKNRFLGDNLQINGEVFYYPYKNYQLQYAEFIDDANYENVIVNSDNMVSYGGEVEVSYILSFNDKIDASVAYLTSDLGELPGDLAEYSGYSLDHSPEWTLNFNYQHRWDLSNGGNLVMAASTHYETSSWMVFKRTEGSLQPAYHKSNLSLKYGSPNGKWDIQTYVRNIEDYPVMTHFAGFSSTYYNVEAPRTYGLILSVSY